MKKRSISILLIILCLAVVLTAAGCGERTLIKETDETADILVKDGVFDIDVAQCIQLLNEDLEKENLPLISEEYTSEDVIADDGLDENGNPVTKAADEGEAYTIYHAKITDTIELQLRSFKRLDGGIPVIEVINTAGKNQQSEDAKLLKRYFSVICGNVEPRFDVEQFNINVLWNEHYELNDLFFWCGQMNSDDQAVRLYFVTTNSDLFSHYMYNEE